jgi:uncharacterized protein (DUF924 family)
VTPEVVLDFWFGTPPADEAALMAKTRRWFEGGYAMDREVNARFAAAVEDALEGRLDSWSATPRGRLALVILLDQFTRNVFRDAPRMYAGDAHAQALAIEAFTDGSADRLTFVEQLFLSLPLLHSERLDHHERDGEIANGIATKASPLYQPLAAMRLEQSAKYRDVIARFGRFPHRNAVLGRITTPEEQAWLDAGGGFG